jgi:hypothetical protein
VIRVYDEAGNVIETHEHKGDFKEPWRESLFSRAGVDLADEKVLNHYAD